MIGFRLRSTTSIFHPCQRTAAQGEGVLLFVFLINDSYDDGMCCQYVSSRFGVTYDGWMVQSGDSVGFIGSFALGKGW
jgi:hypothetical protein